MAVTLQQWVRSTAFVTFVDIIVAFNLVIVGLEVDLREDASMAFDMIRHCLCGIYILELMFRLVAEGKGFFFDIANLVDLVIVICAIIDAWILQRVTWFWRLTVLRAVRFRHIINVVRNNHVLKDLWLVLVGLGRASKALCCLGVVLLFAVYVCAVGLTGLVGARKSGRTTCVPSINCIDEYEYFGSVSRSMLTLFQCATLDGWASHVLRPLARSKPMQAVLVGLFAVMTAYGLLSIAIGVLVHSTVDLARSHQEHAAHQAEKNDKELIDLLKDYFAGALYLEDRNTLDETSLRDAMSVPEIGLALRKLELPVHNVEELFDHLDKKRKGEITIKEFEKGLKEMKQPSSRYDMALVSASVGGAATCVGAIERRAENCIDGLKKLEAQIGPAFACLEELSRPEGAMGQVPEVRLRAAHRIRAHVLPVRQRYT